MILYQVQRQQSLKDAVLNSCKIVHLSTDPDKE